MTKVFLDYTQEELDRAYDQRNWAQNIDATIGLYGSESAAARAALTHSTHAYGPTADEVLDFFPAALAGAPTQIFIHGGSWRTLSKNESAAAAPMFIGAGANYVALNFSTIPTVRIPDMVAQVRRAIVWIWRHAAELKIDSNALYISGHSSGGHLCGVVLTTDWAALGAPANLVKGGTALSGMYEMIPVMLSSRREFVKLSEAEVGELSAMRHLDRINCPVIVGHGAGESPEFQRQSNEFAAALRRIGRLQEQFVFAGLDHFTAPQEMNRRETPLAQAILRQMGL